MESIKALGEIGAAYREATGNSHESPSNFSTNSSILAKGVRFDTPFGHANVIAKFQETANTLHEIYAQDTLFLQLLWRYQFEKKKELTSLDTNGKVLSYITNVLFNEGGSVKDAQDFHKDIDLVYELWKDSTDKVEGYTGPCIKNLSKPLAYLYEKVLLSPRLVSFFSTISSHHSKTTSFLSVS